MDVVGTPSGGMTRGQGYMSKKNSQWRRIALTGAAWTAAATIVEEVGRVIVQAVLARLLAPSDFGLVALALGVVGVATTLVQFGFVHAIIQRRDLRDSEIAAVTRLLVFGGAIGGVGIWFLAPVLARTFGSSELLGPLRAFAPLLVLRAIAAVGEAMLARELRFKVISRINVAATLAGYSFVALIGGLLGLGVWALVLGNLAHAIVKLLAVAVWAPKRGRNVRPDWSALGSFFRFGLGVLVGRTGNQLGRQVDIFLIGKFLGPELLGFYSRSMAIVMLPVLLLGGVMQKLLTPLLSRLQEDRARYGRGMTAAVELVSITVLPCLFAMVVLADEIVALLLGPGWSQSAAVVRVLAGGLLFRIGYKVADAVLMSSAEVYRRAAIQWAHVLLVGGAVAVGQRAGLEGAAFGVLGAVCIQHMTLMRVAVQVAGTKAARIAAAHFRGVPLAVTFALPLAIAAFWMRRIEAPPVLVLLGSVVCGLLVSGGVLRLHPRLLLGAEGMRTIHGAAALLKDRRSSA